MKSLVPAGAIAVAALVLAGCSYVNPITTQQNYAASDGVQMIGGDFDALNLMVITAGQGEPAVLLGALHNPSADDIEVEISFDAQTATSVSVPGGSTVQLTPLDGVEVTGTAPVMPGLLVEVGFATGANGFFTTEVPVLDGTLSEYQPVLDAIG
ncbi:MAG: hypothetical protein ACK4MD_02780 [Demequina sp.]